jgi:hypothetical protein
MDITQDEAQAIEAMRKSGKDPAEFVAAATKSDQEPAGDKKPTGDDDRPVTHAELQARDQAAQREQVRQQAKRALDGAADQVIAGAKDLGNVSDSKRRFLRDRAYELARDAEGVEKMSPPQLQSLIGEMTQKAIEEELTERKSNVTGGATKEDLDKRMEAGSNAADRSQDAGSGGSSRGAGTPAEQAAAEILGGESDMQFGPGIEQTWPTEEAIRAKRAQAADAFLAKAYGDNRGG